MKTHAIDLSANTKSTVISILNDRLAEGLDLALVTKQAHWNLKGPTFIAVHLMLDDLRAVIDEHTDTIAERVSQLDGVPLGTAQAIAAGTSLKPYPTDIHKVSAHLENLVERYGAAANNTRKSIADTEEAGDADAADILTAYSRGLDKALWFLKSHLE